jgi:hypothetical protein
MSPRTIGLIAGVVAAMVVALALPPDDVTLLVFGTLALVALFCALGWLIGGQFARPAEEERDPDAAPPKPPARHVFIGAGAAILVVLLFAVPAANSSSFIAAFGLLAVAVVVGVGAGAVAKRFWKP